MKLMWIVKIWSSVVILVLALAIASAPANAQTQTPPAKLLMVYDASSATLVNISKAAVPLRDVILIRDPSTGIEANFLATRLNPGECFTIKTPATGEAKLPPECTRQVNFFRTSRQNLFFWLGSAEYPSFRAKLGTRTMGLCKTSISGSPERCEFDLLFGDPIAQPVTIRDLQTGEPMPMGLYVAYDQNQLWVGNFTPETVLPTRDELRIIYTVPSGATFTWTPKSATWDAPGFDLIGLKANECVVLYRDRNAVSPLLDCKVVAYTNVAEAFWLVKFAVAGPREGRESECNSGGAFAGPVLCVLAG